MVNVDKHGAVREVLKSIPAFDKNGRPVDYLDRVLEPAAAADDGAASAPAAGAANPTELWRARVKAAGLKAPWGRGSS